MKITQLEDKIFYYENLISDPEKFIDDISIPDRIDRPFQISKWDEWKSSSNDKVYGESKSGSFSNIKFSSQEDISISLRSMQTKFISDIAFKNYILETKYPELQLPDYFNIRKYDVGANMGQHVDSSDETDLYHPVVSGVLYINDDYEGGELVFLKQEITVKPSAGSLVIFPSSEPYLHRPMPVTSGVKYMVPFFWYPMQTEWGNKK